MPRGGRRPNTGGKRPGAGRKPKAVEEYRLRMQGRFEAVSQEDVDAMIQAVVARVKKDGDPKAFQAVASYIFGPAPKELTVKGDPDAPLVIREMLVELPPEADSEESEGEEPVGG